jgi:UDP-glucose 4-epimerase
VRDYLHVMDLARAHLAALDWTGRAAGAEVFNLGTGAGVSVLEAVAAFERVSGRAVPLEMRPRRAGDVAACHADPGKAARVLGWRTERDLGAICASAWDWASANPAGYGRSSAESGED